MPQLILPVKPRILISRADRIGDLVLATPVFEALRKKFPDAWITCLTLIENREIVEGNPFLNEILLYDKKGREKNGFGHYRFARQIRKKHFDMVIHLHATHRMHTLTWIAKIPIRVGYDRKSSWALTLPLPDMKFQGAKHEAQYNFDLLNCLGILSPDLDKLRLYFPEKLKAQKSLQELLKHKKIPDNKPWIVLSPSASCPSKKWPADRFAKLIDRISEKGNGICLVIGTKADEAMIRRIKRLATAPFYDLSGELSLAMVAELLSKTALLISNDSGPVHIASAKGTPVISIFGRNQPGLAPARWRPLGPRSRIVWKDVGCDPCLAHDCHINFLCLESIFVEDILKEAEPLLASERKEIMA